MYSGSYTVNVRQHANKGLCAAPCAFDPERMQDQAAASTSPAGVSLLHQLSTMLADILHIKLQKYTMFFHFPCHYNAKPKLLPDFLLLSCLVSSGSQVIKLSAAQNTKLVRDTAHL